MGLADIVSRARAGSILRSSVTQDTPTSGHSSEKPPLNEKQPAPFDEGRNHRVSFNSNGTREVDHTISRNREPHHVIRTVPTWVHVLEAEEEESSHPTASLLPSSPPSAQVAQHHYHPSDRPQTRAKPPRGRLYDADRDWAPPVPHGHPSEHTSRWRAYLNASAYPAITSEGGEIVTPEWLAQNGPDYSQLWMAGAEEWEAGITGFKAKRKVWWKRLQRTIIRSPMIPLVLRSIVWIFSVVALALASSIHHYTDRVNNLNNLASTEMAIIVDAIALVYLLYITYDEYTGKPLGLRSARAKMRLIFLDLFFIVFDSANLSLAFEAVGDTATCTLREDITRICKRQDTLASVLLIALIAWLLTFSISVLRQLQHMRPTLRTFQNLSPMATSKAPLTALKDLRVSSHQIPALDRIPNTSIQRKPLLIYHSAFQPGTSTSTIESHLNTVGAVVPQWRYTMYSTSHFHSNTHEVLAIASGKAKLCFGGEDNPKRTEPTVAQGDVIVVPAGVAHRLLDDIDGGFTMVGSYPKGKSWDMCYGKEGEEEKVRGIEHLGWFERDPIYGQEGPSLNV
ncbi:MAG: hypothetical protein Q9181_001819 [Wetmoreana brouardii]